MYVDSHCHLSFPVLADHIDEIRAAMAQAQVDRALCICTTLEEFDAVHELANRFDNFWCSAGVHPDNEGVREPSVSDLVALARRPRVVAIGETGLDYFRLNGRSVAEMGTYLRGRQHFYCMNYYVDERALEIPEKNIFTATEITTLIPLRGSRSFKDFFTANSWTKSFLPNNYLRVSVAKDDGRGFSRLIEKILNNPAGEFLDNCLMKLTGRRWRNKTNKRKMNNNGVIMSMIAEKHISKPDPGFFQTEFIKNYTKKTFELSKKHPDTALEINLNHNI